jgi:alkylated DNA repair dioxygenase AlkB
MQQQADLFEAASQYPAGFRYAPEFISPDEERRLVEHLQRLDFKPFDFHGFLGKRRVISFGWRYDFNGGGLTETDDMPEFLLPLRDRAAAFAGLKPVDLQQVLLTEYQPGAPIGWHKDRSVFGDVVGVSLLSACTFRFRRKAGADWKRSSLVLAPRSAYLLHGPARTEWEHSIPAVTEPRYSLTFRNFRDGAQASDELFKGTD